jgi:hypothetical protein
MFRRAIKKDPSLFPVLKDDKYHDVWNHSFNTQAVAKDVADVLDEMYVPTTVDDMHFSLRSKSLYMLFLKVKSGPIAEKPLLVVMNMTLMCKRCTRSLRTTILSLPRPRLNHLSFSLTSPQQNLVMGPVMVLLKPLSFTGKIKYVSMRNMVLQLIISQMVRNVSCSKILSMVLMSFVRSRILLTIWEQHPALH